MAENVLTLFPDSFFLVQPQVSKTLNLNTQPEGRQDLLKSSKDWGMKAAGVFRNQLRATDMGAL